MKAGNVPEKHRNYLTRRQNGIYYFRMAVPRAVRAGYDRNEVCFSLKTTDRKTAQIQVARYVEQYLVEFSQKTVRPKKADPRFPIFNAFSNRTAIPSDACVQKNPQRAIPHRHLSVQTLRKSPHASNGRLGADERGNQTIRQELMKLNINALRPFLIPGIGENADSVKHRANHQDGS